MAKSFLVHDFSQHAPDCPVVCGTVAEGYDEILMRRIAAALQRSVDRTAVAGDDMWSWIIANHQQPFIALLTTGQLRAANEMLARMFATPLTFGFEQAQDGYERMAADPAHRHYPRRQAFDKLLALAAFLRAVPVQCGEQGDFLPTLRESPDGLLEKIEGKLQRAIRAPRFHGGLFAISTSRGLFSERSLMALYTALRVTEILGGSSAPGNHHPEICEIGGGAGYLAYWCNWLGLTRYTIVDLPAVSAVQAYFLAQNLGGADRITLGGETMPTQFAGVRLIDQTDFIAGAERFDLIVNVDSFPEISGPVLRGYLDHSRRRCRILLSINQEAMAPRSADPDDRQERVGDVIDEIGGFRRLARHPFWMRPGYVEEIYQAAAEVAA